MANPVATTSFEDPETVHDGPRNGPTPSVSLKMSLNSNIYKVSILEAGRPNLTFIITSEAEEPITIHTFQTVLDSEGAWSGEGLHSNFTALESATKQRIWFKGRNICRGNIRRQLGHHDEKYFLTLLPHTPVEISYPLRFSMWNRREPGSALTFVPRAVSYGGEEFRRYFEPGKRYRFGLATQTWSLAPSDKGQSYYRQEQRPNQVVLWWRYGTNEEALEPRGVEAWRTDLGWSEPQISIGSIPDIEFLVEE